MKTAETKQLVLAGDIGGTKTNIGLFYRGPKGPRLKVMEQFSSPESPDLETIIDRFRHSHPARITAACFGIAGPVVNGRCKTTNLPWVVSEGHLKKRFRWSCVRLINDLIATALAVAVLPRRDFLALNAAKPQKGQPVGLIAPGTGLVNIYRWLRDSGRYREPRWLAESLGKTDPAQAITAAALDQKHPLCRATLDRFVSIFGAASGNLALTALTTGGVYLGGGIAPKILSELKQKRFMSAFSDKGRFKNYLEKIAVRVILNDKAALVGAASFALEMT